MLFDNGLPEKGLFTFYFEQGLEDHHSHPSKQKQKQEAPQALPGPPSKQKRDKERSKLSVQHNISRNISKKEAAAKFKLESAKQRLVESVVDLGKNTQLEEFKAVQRSPPNPFRSRELSVIIKPAEGLRGDSGIYRSQQKVHYTPELSQEEFNLHSFQRHKMTQKAPSPSQKAPARSERAVVELPAIRSPEVRREERPRKSLKSQLIQEALHSGDHARIKQIRQFLRGDSPLASGREQPPEEPVSRSMRVFEFRQEKLLEILRRFKKE